MRRRVPLLLIGAWVVAGALALPAGTAALDGRGHAVTLVVTIEAFVLWGAVWIALLVPRMATLTAARVGVPCALVGSVAALIAGGASAWSIAAVAAALVAIAALALPATIDAFVDGSSYGPEHRFGLRTPPLTAIVAVPVTWLAAAAVLVVPPFAAATWWIPAVVVVVLWAAVVRWALRSLHLPARRWVVFVPAGMVLNDPLMLTDALLFPRRNIATLGPAYAGSDGTDVTQGALGLALQIDLTEPFEVPLRAQRHTEERTVETDRILFAVLRPGALLDEAASRRVTVGATRAADAPSCVHAPEESQTAVPLPRTRSSR